jgi:hypothetical protein
MRQFDTARTPKIDIIAEIDMKETPKEVEVRETKSDLVTPVGISETTPLFPVGSLLDVKDYPYSRPIVNLYMTFAGDSKGIAKLADAHDFLKAVTAAFRDIQPQSIRLCVLDIMGTNKLVVCKTPEEAAEVLLSQAKGYAEAKPHGIKGFFSSTPSITLDKVIHFMQAFLANDAIARGGVANSLVVFWVNGPSEDARKVDEMPFREHDCTVTIGEIARSSDFTAERARSFCIKTGGSFLSREDLQLKFRDKANYQALFDRTFRDLKVQLKNKHMLTAITKNPESMTKAYFDVSVPGCSIRESIVCERGSKIGEVEKGNVIQAIRAQFAEKIEQKEFQAGLDLIDNLAKHYSSEDLRRWNAVPASLKTLLAEKWEAHLLALSDAGVEAKALRELDVYNDTKLVSRDNYDRLIEAIYFNAGSYAINEAKDQARAMNLLNKWRETARRAGHYDQQAKRASVVALQLARFFATDVSKDQEFADEFNELERLDPALAASDRALPLLTAWICRNLETADVSARLARVADWDQVMQALAKNDPKCNAIRRFFVNATARPEARDELLQLRLASKAKESPIPGYVAWNRALILAEPIAVALKTAAAFQIDSTSLSDLINKTITGFDEREAVLYRPGEGMASKCMLAGDGIDRLSARQGDIGFGIRIEPSFLQRLSANGKISSFEGVDNEHPVVVSLIPVGPENFIRIAFSDVTAPVVQRELKTARIKATGMSKDEVIEMCLNIQDVRDAELTCHMGAELMGHVINSVGIDKFLTGGGRDSIKDFYAGIPSGIKGFVLLDKLLVRDNSLARDVSASIRLPAELGEDVKTDRRVSGAAYALWEKPYFEVGIPIRDKGEKVVAGILRVGIKSYAR